MGPNISKTLEKLRNRGFNANLGTDKLPPLTFIPTGSLVLDAEMGTRGFPVAKFVHIYGPASVGKSLLALSSAGFVTRAGFGVILIDAENSFDREELLVWRRNFGIVDEHLVQIPGKQSAQKILDATNILLAEHPDYFRLIIIDSLSGMASFQTQDKDMKDGHIDDIARLARRFTVVLNTRNDSTCVILIAHTMAEIGTLRHRHTAKGGEAPKYFSSIRLDVSGSPITESRDEFNRFTKRRLNIQVEKNKIAPDGGIAKNLIFNLKTGCFDMEEDLMTLAIQRGIVTPSGTTWVEMGGKKYTRSGLKELLATSQQHVEWLFYTTMGMTLEEYFTIV